MRWKNHSIIDLLISQQIEKLSFKINETLSVHIIKRSNQFDSTLRNQTILKYKKSLNFSILKDFGAQHIEKIFAGLI